MATIHAFDPNPSSTPKPGLQQAAQFDGILEQSRDLICERLDQAVAAMLDKAKDALTVSINETRNFDERRLYEDARAVIVAQRAAMEKQFRTRYLGEFRTRSDRARKIGQAASAMDDVMDRLELIGEDDFEETLKFNNMAAKLRAYCDEELIALDQRVGVLLGDANLQANDNPFSPNVICDAYKDACRQVDAPPAVRRVLLKLFDDHVLDDVRSMYKAVNGLLVQNAILPKIRYSVSRTPGGRQAAVPGTLGKAGTPADPNTGAPASDITTGVAQDLFTILQNLAANNAVAIGRPGAGSASGVPGVSGVPGIPGMPGAPGIPGVPGIPGIPGAQVAGPAFGAFAPAGTPGTASGGAGAPLQGAELQNSLTRIQLGDMSSVAGGTITAATGTPATTNVLHELRATSVGAGMGSLDLMTLDIIAMLFDQLFDDPKVPNGIKGLIGRLQIPMLKVAIADKTFFSTKAHPARRLLDTLGEVALRLPAEFGPADTLFARLQHILEELVERFRDDLEIFTTTRARVEALLAEEDQRIEEETRAAAKRVEEMENLAVARRSAEMEIKARIEAHNLPGPVLEFLAQQWLKLLLLLHVKEGKDSTAWKGAVEAMDLLIWSIEPKGTREERRKLVGLIPGLLRKIAVGLKVAGIDGYGRSQFFSELMKYHRHAISVPEEGKPDSASTAGETDGAAASEQTDPVAASARAAQSLDFSAPITVKNPYGDGEVNVDSLDLDFTAFEGGGGRSPDADPLANLAVGAWVAFRDPAEQPARRPARLIFVTPRKTRYLFALDRAGKDIIQCTPGEISRRFRVGEAVFIEEPRAESLFDRIMKGLIGKLRTPAAAGSKA